MDREQIDQTYGSVTRANQLQNYPNNLVNQSGQNIPISYEDAEILQRQTRPNNISDMQQLGRMAASEQGLFDLLGRLFNGEGIGAGVLQYANPIIENKDLYKPQPQPNPHAKGFGRPYVMSLQEYVDNYLPYYGLDYQNIPKEELPQR